MRPRMCLLLGSEDSIDKLPSIDRVEKIRVADRMRNLYCRYPVTKIRQLRQYRRKQTTTRKAERYARFKSEQSQNHDPNRTVQILCLLKQMQPNQYQTSKQTVDKIPLDNLRFST